MALADLHLICIEKCMNFVINSRYKKNQAYLMHLRESSMSIK